MSTDSDFYVFREGRRSVAGQQLLRKLRESLSRAADESGWTDALLRCGELECALEDSASPHAELVAGITEECARRLLGAEFRKGPEFSLPETLRGELTISTPEGFAYYALHPLRYADAAEQISAVQPVVVIGIRSIGTTLSAVVASALRKRGAAAQRFTVRPEGHPFDRVLRWSASQLATVRERARAGATFLIVDEGPGLSGSSFLSVAEALRDVGVPADKIVLMPAYAPSTSRLRVRDAAQRWENFRCVPIGDGWHPEGEWLGGGTWRERFLPEKDKWPGAWTTMERSKFLSADHHILWKFEGLGPYGESSRERSLVLADAGWSVPAQKLWSGFTGYRFLATKSVAPPYLDSDRIQRIAHYCAFRAGQFACDVTSAQQEDLTTMLRVNFEREFHSSAPAMFLRLEVVRPAVCDAKMSPQKWLQPPNAPMLKLDASLHGDDHFFPGPCDIAWDLAGAIVEWEMDEPAKALLLNNYREASGDDAWARIDGYVLAYSLFRLGWCKTAASGMQGTDDEERLLHEYRKYRAYVQRIGVRLNDSIVAARARNSHHS